MLNGPSWGGETSAAVQAGRSYDGGSATQQRELDAIHEAVRTLNMRLGAIVDTARNEADALFGVRAQAAAGNKAPTPPSISRVAGLCDALRTAHEIVSEVESQVGRFAAL